MAARFRSESLGSMTAKLVRLRYQGTCSRCASALAPGTRGWWDSQARTATCLDCRPAGYDSRVPVAGPEQIRGMTNPDSPAPPAHGEAGASARQMFEQKHRRREERIERKWGRLAGVVKFVSTDPQSARAWANGSTGERRLASHLVKSVGDRAVLLHDRKIPGSQSNIDHLAIAASGIWIIDAKNYTGKVEQRDVGGLFSIDQRLYVNGHDHTKLVAGFAQQVNAVLEAIGEAEIAINAALCFVDSEWGFFAKPLRQGGVWVTWPTKLCEMIAASGTLTRDDVTHIGERLAAGLPPSLAAE
jgi:hypothetical protein